MKYIRWLVIAAGILVGYVVLSWLYTTVVVARARSNGVFSSAEEGMQSLMDKYYAPDHEVKIYFAGPNDLYGKNPYVWYVIAEVHASARADGSALGMNGCDSPGTFFVQLKDGNWVHIPEGFYTTFMTSWMKTFDVAGEGESEPSIDLISGPMKFCQ